jgi:gluconokinase
VAEEMSILVLEASTTSAKAMLLDTASGSPTVLTEPYLFTHAQDGTHDADEVVSAVLRLAGRLLDGRPVAAISLVGVWHGLLLADRQVTPTSPVSLWSSDDAAGLCRRLRGEPGFAEWFGTRTGCGVSSIYPVFRLRHLRESGVSLADRLVLDEGSYLNWVLTGEVVQTTCLASGSGLLNTRSLTYDADVLDWAGVRGDQVPRLAPPRSARPLSPRGAVLMNLPAGTPVILAIADGAANQVGSGALRPEVMTVSVGTSGAVRLAVGSPPAALDRSTWCYVSTHGWLSGAATSGACNCIDWFRENVASGRPAYEWLEGAGMVGDEPVFLPFLHGERSPGWDDSRRAEFRGLTAHHDIHSLYRAVQEGVLFNLLQCYEALVAQHGAPRRVTLSGGILSSARWTQMCSDVFGTDVELDATQQASLMGGAVLALELLGELPSATHHSGRTSGVASPRPDASRRHRDRYAAYTAAYGQESTAVAFR